MAEYLTIPIETLHRLLICDPVEGTLTWRHRPLEFFKTDRDQKSWNKRWAGKLALSGIDKDGYAHGRVLSITLRAHRVIWAMVMGEWPVEEIDHEDGVRTHNQYSNLKEASDRDNAVNRKLSKKNKTGVSGVSWDKTKKRWRARVRDGKKQVNLGYFRLLIDAVKARKAGEASHGYHPNHGRPG